MWSNLHMYSIQMIDDKFMRTLFVRLPHVIRNRDEVEAIFSGDIKIRFPKKSSRNCYVTFTTMKEAVRNLKTIRNKAINKKYLIVYLLRSELLDQKRQMKSMLKIKKYDVDITSEDETDGSSEYTENGTSIDDEAKSPVEEMAFEE